MEQRIKAAAAQFHVGSDINVNLESCLRLLDKAGEQNPDIVVLPEFCNHLSWYDDADHCYRVSLTLEGDFLQAIAAKAREIAAFVVVGVTLQREGGKVSGSNLLYSPAGELLGLSDKQVLIGHENDFLERADQPGAVTETALGRLGLYMCMDGVINETPRCLALRGADIMLNSLNSFAPDEGSLHIPVRAAENKVFVVAANKVGPLVPEAMMEGISAATNIPVEFLNGAGESQIVAPDGTVLAMAKTREEEVVFAEFDVTQARDKRRPDGTDIFSSRRPELYSVLGENPESLDAPVFSGAAPLPAALIQLENTGAAALDEAKAAVQQAVSDGARLIALPGLFCLAEAGADNAVSESEAAIAALADVAGDALITTSLVLEAEGGKQHCAVAIGAQGLVARQGQVHYSERFSWSVLSDRFDVFKTEFGCLALMCSDDSIYPEAFRLVAMQGADVVSVPLMPLEQWELTTGLIERAAENRVNLLAAMQPSELGNSFGAALHEDFTIFGEWKTRQFDGVLTYPMLTRADSQAGVTPLVLHPKNAENKVVSHRTHLIDGRPWHLLEPLLATKDS